MSDSAAATTKGRPVWHLLGKFSVSRLSGCKPQRFDPVMEAVQGLDLQPAQLETIRQAFAQALARTPHTEEAAVCGLHIRIWVLDGCASGRGWGLFLVDKGINPECTHVQTERLMDLYLYQECDG